MIQKDLDDEIDYYRRKKIDEALSVERRQRIQTAISLGELDACLYQGNRFQYGPLTITPFQRRNWRYSDAVKALQEQAEKAEEQALVDAASLS